MTFHIFQVEKNAKSNKYYNDDFCEKFVYIIFEEHTGYIFSNSNQLFLELEVAQGVSQTEFDHEGIQFRSILAHLAMDYCEKHGISF